MQNILLAALGTTPQIISESLYHLMVIQQIPIHEIHLITTTTGAARAEKSLFDDGAGPFYRFCKEYGFSSTEIVKKYHIITDASGTELSDIRTPEDNEAAADFFLTTTKELTNRQDTRIFATIAGGRKTMSAYLYFVMQLLGRDQDTLYHVLVQPASIESNPTFYYPHQNIESMEFKDRAGNSFSVPLSEIRIDMAEIPFVRLSQILTEGMIASISNFSDLVSQTQAKLDKAQFEPELVINLPRKEVTVWDRHNTWQFKLRPMEMCFYAHLCQVGSVQNSSENAGLASELSKLHSEHYAIANVNKSSFNNEALQRSRSKINRIIKDKVSSPLVREFLIINTTSEQKYGSPTYSINLSPDKIRIIKSES